MTVTMTSLVIVTVSVSGLLVGSVVLVVEAGVLQQQVVPASGLRCELRAEIRELKQDWPGQTPPE